MAAIPNLFQIISVFFLRIILTNCEEFIINCKDPAPNNKTTFLEFRAIPPDAFAQLTQLTINLEKGCPYSFEKFPFVELDLLVFQSNDNSTILEVGNESFLLGVNNISFINLTITSSASQNFEKEGRTKESTEDDTFEHIYLAPNDDSVSCSMTLYNVTFRDLKMRKVLFKDVFNVFYLNITNFVLQDSEFESDTIFMGFRGLSLTNSRITDNQFMMTLFMMFPVTIQTSAIIKDAVWEFNTFHVLLEAFIRSHILEIENLKYSYNENLCPIFGAGDLLIMSKIQLSHNIIGRQVVDFESEGSKEPSRMLLSDFEISENRILSAREKFVIKSDGNIIEISNMTIHHNANISGVRVSNLTIRGSYEGREVSIIDFNCSFNFKMEECLYAESPASVFGVFNISLKNITLNDNFIVQPRGLIHINGEYWVQIYQLDMRNNLANITKRPTPRTLELDRRALCYFSEVQKIDFQYLNLRNNSAAEGNRYPYHLMILNFTFPRTFIPSQGIITDMLVEENTLLYDRLKEPTVILQSGSVVLQKCIFRKNVAGSLHISPIFREINAYINDCIFEMNTKPLVIGSKEWISNHNRVIISNSTFKIYLFFQAQILIQLKNGVSNHISLENCSFESAEFDPDAGKSPVISSRIIDGGTLEKNVLVVQSSNITARNITEGIFESQRRENLHRLMQFQRYIRLQGYFSQF